MVRGLVIRLSLKSAAAGNRLTKWCALAVSRLLVDLMAAMTRALGQHVQMQLQTEAGVVNGSETLSDFLSQQCAARFFSFLVDAKASAEQRNLALNFLVFCNLVLKGGALQ